MKKIFALESWFFMFFGLFHLHRIWAPIDREAYTSFWMEMLNEKSLSYFLIMGYLLPYA